MSSLAWAPILIQNQNALRLATEGVELNQIGMEAVSGVLQTPFRTASVPMQAELCQP